MGLPALRASEGTKQPLRGLVTGLKEDGLVTVQCGSDGVFDCEVLASTAGDQPLQIGDRVIALAPNGVESGVVLGRIERNLPRIPQTHVSLEASESMALKCGNASVELRADGTVMIRGDDVLVRAKGTKRIRAGTVSIN
jgi:hypothetical protein